MAAVRGVGSGNVLCWLAWCVGVHGGEMGGAEVSNGVVTLLWFEFFSVDGWRRAMGASDDRYPNEN